MRIRLQGGPSEINGIHDIDTVAQPYGDRPPSELVRVYLSAGPAGRTKPPRQEPR